MLLYCSFGLNTFLGTLFSYTRNCAVIWIINTEMRGKLLSQSLHTFCVSRKLFEQPVTNFSGAKIWLEIGVN